MKFIQQDAYKVKRVDGVWKKPRGKTSKVRLQKRGQTRIISQGYRSPKKTRGNHPSGLMPVQVNRPEDLTSIDIKKEGAVIGSTVGVRKKVRILEEGIKLKVMFLNVKDPKAFIAQTKEKQSKKEKKTKKEKKVETSTPKSIEETLVSEEEKKERSKKEKDKALITNK